MRCSAYGAFYYSCSSVRMHAFTALYVSASMPCINIHVQPCENAVVFSQSLFGHKYAALLRLLGQAFIQSVACCLSFFTLLLTYGIGFLVLPDGLSHITKPSFPHCEKACFVEKNGLSCTIYTVLMSYAQPFSCFLSCFLSLLGMFLSYLSNIFYRKYCQDNLLSGVYEYLRITGFQAVQTR